MELVILACFRSEWAAQARPPDLHALPDAGAGEGIPHESLPHKAEADRNGARVMFDGKADQNMVPESTDEAQERDTGDQGAERAGEAGAGAKGSGGSGSGCASTARGSRRGQLGVRPTPESP